jgi:recombinational DNA repair protein RecT
LLSLFIEAIHVVHAHKTVWKSVLVSKYSNVSVNLSFRLKMNKTKLKEMLRKLSDCEPPSSEEKLGKSSAQLCLKDCSDFSL